MKKMTKFYFTFFTGIAVIAVIITGCATKLAFTVQRTPTLNTLGIQRLAIMPFTGGAGLYATAAQWLTEAARTNIAATNHFTLVNLTHEQAGGGNAESFADAVFSGQVLSVAVNDSARQGSSKDKDGNIIEYTDYTREVVLSFNYSITRTRDASMLGPVSKTNQRITSTVRNEHSALPSPESMIQTLAQRSMSLVGRDVAPYTVIENRSFEKETSKDKAVKERAKAADAMAKSGNYRQAQDMFLSIYNDTGSFAAAYNAALLIELLGDTEGALSFMQRAHAATGNPKAADAVTRLRKTLDDAGLLEAYQANLNNRERIIKLMLNTIPGHLPANARVALHNNSEIERSIADAIVNGIASGLLEKRITVIDRTNQALIAAERDHQLSGYVSDAEIMRIGNAAGVNTFILVAITGQGATRRCSVRILNVERSTVIYQSPQTDEMNI